MTSSPIQHQTVQLVATQIEKTTSLEQILTPFALDETIIRHLTKEQTGPFVHFWTLEDIIILGMTDTKVPFLEEGLDRLRTHGFTPIVRQAGGLAVVSNEGILNISLLFKNEQMPTINQAYEWMQQLIQQSFPEASAFLLPWRLRFKHSRKKNCRDCTTQVKRCGLCVHLLECVWRPTLSRSSRS